MNAADFAHIKTHQIRDKVYHLLWRKPPGRNPDPTEEWVGRCKCPRAKGKSFMWLWPKQGPENMLFTVLHEVFHASFWDFSEDAVEEYEADCRRLLKRMGLKVTFEK